MKDHFAGAGKPMSEIDRIAKRLVEEVCDADNFESVQNSVNAALLEYGAIVREECAKECERVRNDSHWTDGIDGGATECANAIRGMNADQG